MMQELRERVLAVSKRVLGHSVLGPAWDFHCHLLPGVDDGLRSLQEARAAIEGMQALGYRGAVLTPHIYPGVYDNLPGQLQEAVHDLQQRVGDDFTLRLAAEYFVDESLFEAIERDDLLHLPVLGHKLVLVEYPMLQPSSCADDVMLTLKQAGYQPVLAHVERYRYLRWDRDSQLARLQQLDVWLQCDIGSLVGQYGRGPQQLARWLMERDLVALWGTDLHRVEQLQRYVAPGLAVLQRNRFRINPMLIDSVAG